MYIYNLFQYLALIYINYSFYLKTFNKLMLSYFKVNAHLLFKHLLLSMNKSQTLIITITFAAVITSFPPSILKGIDRLDYHILQLKSFLG